MDGLIWALLLLLIGVLLVVLEVFIPSGGLLSVLAAAAFVAAIVVGYSTGLGTGTLILGLTAIVVPALLAVAVRWWPQTPIGRMILINLPKGGGDVLPDTEPYHFEETLLGRYGRAKTKLLPSGAIVIDGRSRDAISEGMPIEAGQPIKVVAVRTNRIVVRPVDEEEFRRATEQATTAPDDALAKPLDELGLDPLEDPLA